MDTEKYLILEKKIEQGLSPNDEGPFYHHSWWESYKGSIKGKLGGAVIGAVMGAIIGGAVATALVFTAVAPATIGLAFAAITGAGIIYGVHEFSEIGKIVGSQAAGLEQADAREAIRFAALEKKIDDLAETVKGGGKGVKSAPSETVAAAEKPDDEDITKELETYRTTHYAQLKPDKTNRYMFGKVLLIGLLAGAVAGALLAIGGDASAAAHIFEAIGIEGLKHASTATIMAASTITFGMFGASFGLNRDLFRRVFDKTDLWTKGIFYHKKVKEEQIAAGLEIQDDINGKDDIKKEPASKPQETYSGMTYPESETYYQDKVLAAAEKALLSFDHTRATPH